MSTPEHRKPASAFDDLLDGDASSSDVVRTITDEAQANRQAARDAMKRAASHVRTQGEHAARAAHEKAQAVGVSVRRHAPAVVGSVRREFAKPIRWRVVGPILAGSTVLAGAVLAVLLVWNAHRYAVLGEERTTAVVPLAAVLGDARSEPTPPPAAEAVIASPSPRVGTSPPVMALPAGTATTTDTVPTLPVPAPASPTLPTAPSEPSVATCTAAVPLLNGLFASGTSARTPEEIAWAAFGYRCAQNGLLSYGTAGYAPKESEKKADRPRRTVATTTDRRSARPSAPTDASSARGRSVTVPVAAPVPPLTPTVGAVTEPSAHPPGTCVQHGSATTSDGGAMANAPVQITGLDGSHFEQRTRTDGQGRFTVNVPAHARVRVVLRAPGYLDDVRETLNCAPVVLTGKKSNPLSSLFDAARRADRSIQGATGRR